MQKLSAIRERIESRGWEIIETRNIRHLWVVEIWKARSAWSPLDLVLYLSFHVDPQDGAQEFEKIRWLHASPSPPIDWAVDPDESPAEIKEPSLTNSSTVLGRNQDKYFDEFLDGLDAWRDATVRSE